MFVRCSKTKLLWKAYHRVYQLGINIMLSYLYGNCYSLQARETYDDAIASGRAAFLMEESQTSGDIFECLVGNLPPHEDAVVTFAYVIELELEVDGGVCFQLPSVIKPRYQHDTGKGKWYSAMKID